MRSSEVRARLLEAPALAIGRPKFAVLGGSTTNPKDASYIEISRTLRLEDGDFVESVEGRFRGVRVVPPMEWQRVRLQKTPSGTPTATLTGRIAKDTRSRAVEEMQDVEFGVEIRFRWRVDAWYELHRFPMKGIDIGREIFPSLYRRGDGKWLEAS